MSKLALERDFGYTFFDRIVDWVADNLDPNDVFDEEYLIDWAETNGYIKETEA